MELSKEVHGLLDRIRKLTEQTQKNYSYYNSSSDNISTDCTSMPFNVPLNVSHKNVSFNSNEEVIFSVDELIPIDNMDFSDDERWLYVSESSMTNPFTGDLNDWLHEDIITLNDVAISLSCEFSKFDSKKFIDTRTFTRPKKRLSRPSLNQMTEGYGLKSHLEFKRNDNDILTQLTSENSSTTESGQNDFPNSTSNSLTTAPVQFKLSEPISSNAFDRILANANESIDSFQNMSPPSLMNSLCSSTFTTLMDSGYINHDNVPNENNETFTYSTILNENDDPNITYSNDFKNTIDEKPNKSFKETTLNDTYDLKFQNKKIENEMNSTFNKNISNKICDPDLYNLSGTRTMTKKSKIANLTHSFKNSCPDINKTFQKNHDNDLDLTFQSFSESQPNLSEDLKRTILNQSMELMHPTSDSFHTARSGSADSLDERSSSISNSSKESGTKTLNLSDLDNLAKAQEENLHLAMSTPKPVKTHMLLLESNILSPIEKRTINDDYLSDSDLSDSCVTSRSRFSQQTSPRNVPSKADLPNKHVSNITHTKPEVSQIKLQIVPTMIVKPMGINKMIVQPRSQVLNNATMVRPKVRTSCLPRPMSSTGIPRPSTRIPAPKSLRPPKLRPSQPPRTDWMDGCY